MQLLKNLLEVIAVWLGTTKRLVSIKINPGGKEEGVTLTSWFTSNREGPTIKAFVLAFWFQSLK